MNFLQNFVLQTLRNPGGSLLQSECLSVIDKFLNEPFRTPCCLHILILLDLSFVDHFWHDLSMVFLPP